MDDGLQIGREAFDRQAWGQAYEQLASAAGQAPLDVSDLERLASGPLGDADAHAAGAEPALPTAVRT